MLLQQQRLLVVVVLLWVGYGGRCTAVAGATVRRLVMTGPTQARATALAALAAPRKALTPVGGNGTVDTDSPLRGGGGRAARKLRKNIVRADAAMCFRRRLVQRWPVCTLRYALPWTKSAR